jgi:hypothetical protein
MRAEERCRKRIQETPAIFDVDMIMNTYLK